MLKRWMSGFQEKLAMSKIKNACTVNQHRWVGREYRGAWENGAEGTRQIAPVTSGEGGPLFGQPDRGGTDQGVATVY